MRLLTAYLTRELILSFIAVLAVLLLVILGGEVARLLTEALEGRIAADLVVQLVALKIPLALEMLLPLATLLAVMLTLGRLYHDREMDVLAASGISARYFLRLIFSFSVLVAVMAAASALYLSPWALQQERQLLAEGQMRVQVKALTPGRFMPLSASNGVFYAEKISKDGQLEDVFIRIQPEQQPDRLITAPSGYFVLDGDKTLLVLDHGRMNENLVTGDRVHITYFERMTVTLPDWQIKLADLEVEAMSIEQLWAQREQPKMMAHFQWRWFVGGSVLLMAFMGWVLAKVGPRQGRYSRMAYGLGFYLLFTQLAITLRAEIERGDVSAFPGMMLMLLLVALWLLPWQQWRDQLRMQLVRWLS
jgi:lipopolysaccharide export system permease protein